MVAIRIPKAALEVNRFASADKERPELLSMRLRFVGNKCHAEATNGASSCTVSWEDGESGNGEELAVMIPAASARTLATFKGQDDEVFFESEDNTIRCGRFTLAVERDAQLAFPHLEEMFFAGLQPEAIDFIGIGIKQMKIVLGFLGATGLVDYAPLHFHGDLAPVTVRASNGEINASIAMMPFRTDS